LSVIGLGSLYLYVSNSPKRKQLDYWRTKRKTIVITGASDGIGRKLALYFAAHSKHSPVNLVLAARNLQELQKVAKECEELGTMVDFSSPSTRALAIQTDVSIQAQCINLISETKRVFGSVDVVVNNAAISHKSFFEAMSLDMFKRVMDVNFWGTVYLTHAALPHLKASKGLVVNVSSILGYAGFPYSAHYCASKHAIHGFSDSIRIELKAYGVDVLLLAPANTSTHMATKKFDAVSDPQSDENVFVPGGRSMMTSEKAAEMMAEAIQRREREFILAHGIVRYFRVLSPDFMDKLIMKFSG